MNHNFDQQQAGGQAMQPAYHDPYPSQGMNNVQQQNMGGQQPVPQNQTVADFNQHQNTSFNQQQNGGYIQEETPQNQSGNQEKKEYEAFHVYGGKGGLTFNVTESRKGFHTVSIDGAKSIGNRRFDWNGKVTLQITKNELPMLCAVFLGFVKQAKFDNHKMGNVIKGCEVENQNGKMFFKIWQGGGKTSSVQVPINHTDAFYVTGLLLRQLEKNTKLGSIEANIQLIQQVAVRVMYQQFA